MIEWLSRLICSDNARQFVAGHHCGELRERITGFSISAFASRCRPKTSGRSLGHREGVRGVL